MSMSDWISINERPPLASWVVHAYGMYRDRPWMGLAKFHRQTGSEIIEGFGDGAMDTNEIIVSHWSPLMVDHLLDESGNHRGI